MRIFSRNQYVSIDFENAVVKFCLKKKKFKVYSNYILFYLTFT